MAQICQKAANEFRDFTFKQGGLNKHNRQELLEYAYALVAKYGEAEGAAACQFYEEIAEAQDVMVPAAEMAELPEFSEVAKAVNGAFKTSEEVAAGAVQRLTKQVGADTILKMLPEMGRSSHGYQAVTHALFVLH